MLLVEAGLLESCLLHHLFLLQVTDIFVRLFGESEFSKIPNVELRSAQWEEVRVSGHPCRALLRGGVAMAGGSPRDAQVCCQDRAVLFVLLSLSI